MSYNEQLPAGQPISVIPVLQRGQIVPAFAFRLPVLILYLA